MAVLVVQDIARAGLVISEDAAAVGGDDFPNNGNTFLQVSNASGGPLDVTVASNYTSPPTGTAQEDNVVNVADGTTALIGPFPQSGFNDGDGRCNVTYEGVSSMTVAAVNMGDSITK